MDRIGGLDDSTDESSDNSLASHVVQPDDDPAELVEIQHRVLGLLADGNSLRASLGEIVDSLGRLSGGQECMLAWLASSKDLDGGHFQCVGTSGLPTALLADIHLEQASEAALKATLCDRFATHRLAPGQDRPLLTRCKQYVGSIIACGRAEKAVEPVIAERALATISRLVSFAIEFERRSTELSSANARFLALAKSIPGVVYQRIVTHDGDIRYTYISDAAEELFGVATDEIIADPQALFDCHGPEYYAGFRERLLAASRDLKLWDVEATIITRDGKRKFTHAIARPHREPDGTVVWNGVILDQTRIKEAEIAAAAAGVRTRDAIIESIPQAFALYDADDRLVTWNNSFKRLYPSIAGCIKPGAAYADIVRAEIEAGIDPLREGTEIQGRVYERLALRHAPDTVAERRLPDGRWILVNEHRTGDGGSVVLHTDITELKDREAALARSNRELETFASVASHDLQEPLRKIDAFGDRLKRKCYDELGDDGRMYVDRMQSAVTRMRSLINDLLDYSRVTTKASPFASVPLGDVVAGVLGDLQIAIEKAEATVIVEDLPTLDADRTQMRQLFQNLIANAVKFRRPDVASEVRISASVQAADPTHWGSGKSQGRAAIIRVADNGIGFDMKYAERIFGIFQRLHGRIEFEGTGIGLATCRKIVDRHGGQITAESTVGAGTTFVIELPMTQQTSEQEQD